MNSVGGAVGLQLRTASWRPSAHEATMSPIWSSFGEDRGKGLAPGSACGGGRARFACGLLRSSGCYRHALLAHDRLVRDNGQRLMAFADLLGGPGDPHNRRGE